MSSSTLVTPEERAARVVWARRTATRAAARYVSIAQLVFAGVFWAVFGLVAAVVPLIVDQSGVRMDGGGVLAATGYSARWVAFSIAIGTTINLASAHLAAGGTRRTMFRGMVAGSLVAGLAFGLAFGLGRIGERALFGALGWPWVAPGGYSTAPTLGGDALGALGEGIAIAGFALTGAGVAAAFLGMRSLRRGIVVILVALLMAAAVEIATRTGTGGQTAGRWVAEHWLPAGAGGVVAGICAGIAVLALTAGWLWLRLRHLQLRPPV